MSTHLLRFLNGTTFDVHGRMVEDIMEWDRHRLEHVHNYIQWVFPLTERSMYNSDAPLLNYDSIGAIKESQPALLNIVAMSEKMLYFYDFWLWGDEVEHLWWVTPNNHNFLRITRILKCLNLFELHDDVDRWWEELTEAYHAYADTISEKTFNYWKDAASCGTI